MRLLLFSDLHVDLQAAARLVERAATVDVVVGAGDFGTKHEGIEGTINVLAAIDRPAVIVPGNAETVDELREAASAWSSAHVLHGDAVTIDGVTFFGIGGGIPPTPWDWSYDVTEEDAAKMLTACEDGSVLVSHSPPLGVVDRTEAGRRIGSRAVRDTIERTALRLVVCGHIHACWEQEAAIGVTPVVNAGPRGLVREI